MEHKIWSSQIKYINSELCNSNVTNKEEFRFYITRPREVPIRMTVSDIPQSWHQENRMVNTISDNPPSHNQNVIYWDRALSQSDKCEEPRKPNSAQGLS